VFHTIFVFLHVHDPLSMS